MVLRLFCSLFPALKVTSIKSDEVMGQQWWLDKKLEAGVHDLRGETIPTFTRKQIQENNANLQDSWQPNRDSKWIPLKHKLMFRSKPHCSKNSLTGRMARDFS